MTTLHSSPSRPLSLSAAGPTRALALAIGLCVAVTMGLADDARGKVPYPEERPTAGGAAAWLVSGDPDLVGDMWVDLPFAVGPRDAVFFALASRLVIDKSTGNFTFDLRDLQYDMALGWRRRLGGQPFSLYAGQRGRENVDADGQGFVQYLGFGIESRCFKVVPGARCAVDGQDEHPRVEWRIGGGPVFKEREVRAELVVRGQARATWMPPALRGLPVGIDLVVDGLAGGGRFLADAAAGPRIGFPLAGGRSAALFLHYVRGRNPLGLDDDTWALGFALEEGAGPGGLTPPEIDGRVAGGGGEGRVAGQFLLRFLSPAFGPGARVSFLLDGNILTADDTGELYYLYHLGVERPWRGRTIVGAYLFHRSNHQLAEPNDEITSINVLEAGCETRGWQSLVRPSGRGHGSIDASVRAGVLVNSTFGEDRSWHLRGGIRWSPPLEVGGVAPYLLAEGEAGDVNRKTYAVGVALPGHFAVQIEYRDDDHYFGRDATAWLLTTAYGF